MRKPEWLRKKRNITHAVLSTGAKIRSRGLHTVCESARCPNLAECYGRGVATMMILGDTCTRNCRFCNVESSGIPGSPRSILMQKHSYADQREGRAIAEFACDNGLSYLVITSVTRDDLHDGGASHFTRVVSDIKSLSPELKIEVLVPDFKGCTSAVEQILLQPIEVFGHNMETVKRLYPGIRPEADYSQSLEVLATAKRIAARTQPSTRIAASERIDGRILIKSGIMVGLGETVEELTELFGELASVGLDILTIGQYLQPSNKHLPVARYYEPDEFVSLERLALGRGIDVVKAGPYVRSSYLAEESFKLAEGSFCRSLHPDRGT